jgi:eukaryotic-like serine/threonine-protein kinase
MVKSAFCIAGADSADTFLRTILRSGLIGRDELKAALRDVPESRRGDRANLADHLVKKGKLSRFQARKLMEGTALGLVLGPFQILAPIAKGGMGTVYLARDSRSDHLMALKILPPRKAREEKRLLARFRREMEMCQRVAHPHIAWTCEVGVHQGVYYIAMEYIPGKSLYRIVADEGPLKVPRAARLFAEIASALDHAHHQGLVHRDLKPSNVLITPNDHAKLLDLGLAIMEGEAGTHREILGGQGYVVGTMDYIAPEQTQNAAQVDGRSDLYSLGCTLYYALTGQPPFPGGTPLDKIQRQRCEQPTPIPNLNADVPPAFIGLLRRLMSKKPQDRPESAAVVRDELLKWANGEQALPMDQPTDDRYRQEVERLETAELEPLTEADQTPQAESLPVGRLILVEEVEPAAQGKAGQLKANGKGNKQRRRLQDSDSLWELEVEASRRHWHMVLWAIGGALTLGSLFAGTIAFLVIHNR